MSAIVGCSTCWPEAEVARLVEHVEGQVAAATAQLWPQAEVAFGSTVSAGGALRRRVRVGGEALCATVRPAEVDLSSLVRGDHGDLTAVLAGDDTGRAGLTVREAEQLQTLTTYSSLRVAVPTALAGEVMFTPWVGGTSLACRLKTQPAALTELLATLTDDLSELHRDPAGQLRQAATSARVRALPRVVADALSRSTEHLHTDQTTGEVGELRALVGSLSVRLGRLAAHLDPTVFTGTGVAFGNLNPNGVLYPDGSTRAVLVSPALEPGGDLVDTATLLGHLHLLAVGCPPPARAELVEGVEAWLSGQLAACGDQWKVWLSAVLTTWAATVYDTTVTALTLPAAGLPLDRPSADLQARPLPALTVLGVLTRELRRRGAGSALNATLAALADHTADQPAEPAPPR